MNFVIDFIMNNLSYKAAKKYGLIAFLLLFMAVLLIFSDITLRASKRGLLLWSQTMLPTLLPYMIAVNLLLYLLPKNSSYVRGLLVLGPLCGYPMGAKLCASLYANGYLTKAQAEYYLPLINLPSPAYLISFVCAHALMADSAGTVICYLLVLYGATLLYALISGILLKPFGSGKHADTSGIKQPANTKGDFFDCCILDAFTAITKLGGYIILFSILGELVFQLMKPFSELAALLGVGALEITNGTEMIIGSGLLLHQKKNLLLAITSFGGISCLFQTKSLIAGTDISLTYYLTAKAAAALLTILLAGLFI